MSNGKGDRRRKMSISHERCNENWSKIFKKSKRKTTKTKKKNRED
tara:strand:- start:729 stop:863 length:135 start_codon:yes stop_codon:yes gene_type:complete